MPSAKSARVSVRRRKRNVSLRTRAKTAVAKVRQLIDEKDFDQVDQAVNQATVSLDKASQKGALHSNNASRRKSRMMKMLNKAKNEKK